MDVRIRIDGERNLEPHMIENMKPALYEAAKEGNVVKFVHELESEAEKLKLDTILKQMSPSIDKSIYELESKAKKLKLTTILNQVSPSGNSVVHVAARYKGKEIIEFLAGKLPSLITKPNIHGDTPLHVAVRAGQLESAEALINSAKDSPNVGSLLRIKNKNGNTALHEAVIKSNQQEVEFLVNTDPEVAYMENREGKSPLYLAVKLKTDDEADSANIKCKSCCKQSPTLDGDGKEILTTLLQAIVADKDSCCKLEGKSPMHAAIERENLDMLELIVSIKPGLMDCTDKKRRTLLHYAASIGNVEKVQYLLKKIGHATLVKDEDGCHPIHLACENGDVDVVDELLKWWPDPTEFLNNKGQNILHVAAANGKEDVVKYLIRPDWPELVYEKDDDGNTPLHLATIRGQSFAVWSLARCKEEAYFKLKNNQGLTAYNIAEQNKQRDDSEDSKVKTNVQKENSKEIVITDEKKSAIDTKNSKEPDSYDAMMTLSVLHVLQLHAGGCGTLLKNLMNMKGKLPHKEELKDRINTIMVVAALIAGVTFAAAIQTPERESSNPCDQNHTTKVARDALFQLFIIFDTVAMNFSIMAAIVVSWAYLGDINLGSIAVWAASGLLWYSLYMLVFAFLAAVVIVSIRDVIVLWIVVIFEILFVIAHTIFSIPMIIPIRFKHVFIPYIYFLIFCLHYVTRKIVAKCIFCRKKAKKRSAQ